MADKNSLALEIIKRHFKKGTELNKELKLYQSLTKENFNNEYQAQQFVDIVLSERAKLNESILRRQKYNLIKSIKESFVMEDFFKYRVGNYREMASVYKLFEHKSSTSPKEYVVCKNTILETITKENTKIVKEESNKEYTEQPKEVRMLAYKFLVNSFNSKYTKLSESQKQVLKKYINNVDNSTKLRTFVIEEVNRLKVELSVNKNIRQGYFNKLNETINLLDSITNSKVINENQILSLLRYHELLQQLRRV